MALHSSWTRNRTWFVLGGFVFAASLTGYYWFTPRWDAKRVYRIGTDNAFPYHRMIDGKASGIGVDVISEAARRIGMRLEWGHHPQGPYAALKDHKVDLWPVMGKHIEQSAHATKPWLRNDYGLLSMQPELLLPANRGEIRTVALRDSMRSKAVSDRELPRARRIWFRTREEAASALCRGEADVAVMEIRIAVAQKLEPPPDCEGKMIDSSGLTFRNEDLVIASTHEQAAAADALRNELNAMESDGTLQKLLLPWSVFQIDEILSRFAEERQMRQTRWILGASGLFLLMALVLILQHHRMALAQRETWAQTRFMRQMNHELRTPLQGILGSVEMLVQERRDDPATLEALQASALVLQRLVADTLDSSWLDTNQLRLEPSDFALRTTSRAFLHVYRNQASGKGLTWAESGLDTLPTIVHADGVRILQIFSNLISNALKYTFKGGVSVAFAWKEEEGESNRVDQGTHGQQRRGWLTFRVSDTGMGIAQADQNRVFGEFVRLPKTAKLSPGLGLGLFIANRLAQEMGGGITLESVEGQGSTFTCRLPLLARMGLPTLQTPPAKLTGGRWLIVDDSLVNRRILESFVQRAGAKAYCVASGREALAVLDREPFDGLLLDYEMPEMNGLEVARQVRANPRLLSMPIYGCTAHASPEDISACLQAGMLEVLTKPISAEQIARLLARVPKVKAASA